ncbi:TonB-dependent siderophore receptor [Sphingomonas jatrophae]|uniref:Iron complex outermembrane recepter protein n=1 Tax=Sphingomonas jatrophae TaxID=1166337 RepID=A0A1I6K2D4_9SPHN|nr:TonB-dependent siderophore receptor [Sphingomonas jatrophae]SFR85344.1 iron complex outermembrane recepter protein [Sphingomonas jatrophae]
MTLAGAAMLIAPNAAFAAEAEAPAPADETIVVTANRTDSFAGTKTDTPLIQTPQPITVISDATFLSQGAISISDTVRYAAGVTANAYGRDTRVDSFVIRGIDALQFRDGMRDIFSFYASAAADPYNFSRVEIVRGPASVLFGQGSIGGLVNLVSKTPQFETGGELSAVYGSYDRKELLGDVNLAVDDTFAIRAVGRARDADTYVDHVPDDRVMFAPSVRWRPTPDTDITLLGLYQEDDTGSTSQFLPVVGTNLPNGTNPRLDRYLFVGKPGWDRYDGRLLQGGGSISQRFGETVSVNLKARYIDSDLTYFTHYTDSYTNPTNPYLDAARRQIRLYSEASLARLNVFSTDNNVQFKFDTGANISHVLLAGIDYSWNKVRKSSNFGVEQIDLYDIDYDALVLPSVSADFSRDTQKQLGIYVQDQIRFFDRVSVVLGVRRDRVRSDSVTADRSLRVNTVDKATTFRAGIIGEIGAGLSPFFSYTESFLPIAGTGNGALKPQTGRQYEAGVKWQPDARTLVTVTGFHIKENGRPLFGPGSIVTQAGVLTTKGIELEASRTLPGNFELLVNYGYNKLTPRDTQFFDYLPKHNASIWSTKTVQLSEDVSIRGGAGVRYTGKRTSIGPAWTLVTGDNTLVDALAEVTWRQWRFAVNATNLLGDKFYASCLSRGDCFMGAPRNVMGTISYRF